MQKYKFSDVFQEELNGALTPKVRININGTEIGAGTSIGRGTVIGGIDLHQYKYLDIAGEYVGEVFHVKGFFKQ